MNVFLVFQNNAIGIQIHVTVTKTQLAATMIVAFVAIQPAMKQIIVP